MLPEGRRKGVIDSEIADFLERSGAIDPRLVLDTDIASIWKVETPRGPAALKIYPDAGMSNESSGFRLLRHWNGDGAARLFGLSGRAVSLEWLEGPSLEHVLWARDPEMADAERTGYLSERELQRSR